MAGNKVVISFEAQSGQAIGEISRLVSVLSALPKTFEKLNTTLAAVNKNITSLNTRLTTTAKNAQAAGTSTSAASKSMNAMAKASASAASAATKVTNATAAVSKTGTSFKNAAASATTLGNATKAVASTTVTSTSVASAAVIAFGTAFKKVFTAVTTAAGAMGRGFGTAFSTSLNNASTVVSKFRTTVVTGFSTAGTAMSKFFAGVKAGAMVFLSFNDAIRVAAQGITNLGRAMFFFLTIPLLGFFLNLSRVVVDFDDALIRVQKTTGLTDESMSTLSDHIRRLSTMTKSSQVELARTAEVIGQLGVSSVPAIVNLVQIFELFGTAVDMGSDEVALSLGKIANAFGLNLNSSSEEVYRLANVINFLENTTAASAAEIITTMSKWAQAGHMLEVTAWQAASLSASMISLGMSEEEAGTALKRLSSQLIAHADDVASVMGANEKYKDSAAVLNAINEDTIGVWMDIAWAAKRAKEENNQNAQALNALITVADERGGRALGALASDIDNVAISMNNAEQEWLRATSLITEYERAMTSTKSQMALFKNNVNNVAITLGDALLPVINRIISIAIPGLKQLNNAFKAMSDKQKVLLVTFTLGVLALGPLIMLVGQLVHGFNLIFMGVGILVKSFAGLGSGVVLITKLLGGVASVALSWPVIIGVAVVGVLKILSMMGVNIAGIFTGIADLASSWGSALMETYASGLAAGVNAVLQVISMVANLIASFFEAHSPPEQGPLSTIDKWGSALLKTFLGGFATADFGILDEIGSKIEKILTRGKEDEALAKAIEQYAKARIDIANLIDKFNSTGLIDEGLLDSALSGLGDMADEIEELIKRQFEYNRLQKELDRIVQARKGLLASYDDEIESIGAANMKAEDKVNLIRKAMRERDSGLRALAEEEQSLEAQAETAKENVNWQEKMVDAMITQDDLFTKMADAMERAARAIGGAASALEDFQLPEGGFAGIDTSAIEEAQEDIQEFITAMGDGELIFQGLTDGFNGLPALTRDSFATDEAYNYYNLLYDVGQRASEIKTNFDTLVGTLTTLGEKVQTFVENMQNFDLQAFIDSDPMIRDMIENFNQLATNVNNAFGSLDKARATITAFATQAGGQISGFYAQYVQPLVDQILQNPFVVELLGWIKVLSSGWQSFAKQFGVWLAPLSVAFGELLKAFAPLGEALANLWVAAQPLLQLIGGLIGGALAILVGITQTLISGVLGMLGGVLGAILTGLTFIVTGIINIVTGAINVVAGILGLIFQTITALFVGSWDKVKEAFDTLILGVTQIFAGLFNVVAGLFLGVGGAILSGIAGFVDGVITFFKNLYDQLVGHSIIPDMLNDILESFRKHTKLILQDVKEWIQNTIKAIGDKVAEFKAKGRAIVDNIKDGIAAMFPTVVSKAQEMIDTIKGAITDKVNEFVDSGKAVIDGFIEGIKSKLGEARSAVESVISGVVDLIKKLLGIASPSKVFSWMGEMSVKGYVSGVDDSSKQYINAASNTIGNVAMASVPSLAQTVSGDTSFGGDTIQLNFGKDSVRSDDDIEKIALAVERVLNKKYKTQYSFGGR